MPQSMISRTAIVFGSWKIRHQEPLTAQDYALFAVPGDTLLTGALTAVGDLRDTYDVLARWTSDGTFSCGEPGQARCANLSGEAIPLAVVTLTDDSVHISHLLHRIDTHRSLFILPPLGIEQPETPGSLALTLRAGFERNHLAINNWECKYVTIEQPVAELFELSGQYPARTLGEAWFNASFSSAMAPFTSQCGDEFQIWDHNVTASQAEDGGYVWVEHCSRKRKLAVNDPLVQLWRSAPATLSATRRELLLGSPMLEAMAIAVDSPLRALGEYRRYAFSTPCESLQSGNLFVVTFETCVPLAAPDEPVTRVEVCFLKSRGTLDRTAIEADLGGVLTHLRSFLSARRVECLPLADRFAFLHPPATSTASLEVSYS